jgi:membrane protein
MSHLAALLRAAWVEYERDHARYLAVAMIYYALVSLVPLLLLLLGALGLLLRFSTIAADARQQTLLGIEGSFGPELAATITELLNALQRGSIAATIVSLGGLLLAGSVLVRHLRLSFRAIWKYEPPLVSGTMRVVLRATILEKLVSFAMVVGGGGLLLAALVLIAAIQWLGSRMPLGATTGWLFATASSLVLVTITFASMFRFLPPVAMRWRDVWLATLLCAAGWVIASEILAFFGAFLGDKSAYGALGVVLAVMLWMNVVSQMLFFGAELCKIVATKAVTAASIGPS